MRKFWAVVCISILALITGCNEADGETPGESKEIRQTSILESATSLESTTSDEISTDEKAKIEDGKRGKGQITGILGDGDAKRLGVDKTLIWIVPDGSKDSCPTEAAVNKLNEILVNKYGCDFVVEFHTYYHSMSIRNNYKYFDMILDMKELGHQADILYSGNADEYHDFLQADIYEAFTEYFMTEHGQKLYNAYAEEIWKKTTYNGEVYGYVSLTYPGTRAAAVCNKNVATKYGLGIDGEWSFYDIGRYLEKIEITKSDKVSDTIIPVYSSPKALTIMEGYHNNSEIGEAILFKADEEYGWVAVNPAKEEPLIRLWKKVKEYRDKGWYATTNENGAAILANSGNFLFAFNCYYRTDLVNDRLVLSDNSLCDVAVGNLTYGPNELMNNMVTGVATWSEYKEEAFELLTLIQTSKELSNLLYYGVEGEDYTYYNNMPVAPHGKKKIDLPVVFADNSNINLLYSVLAEPADKLEYSKEISKKFPDGISMVYNPDIGRYKEQLGRIGYIYKTYTDTLFSGNSKDVDMTVKELQEKLSVENIDEIVDEINRQIREQRCLK